MENPGGTTGSDPNQFERQLGRDGEEGAVADRIVGGRVNAVIGGGETAPEEAPGDKERRDEEAGQLRTEGESCGGCQRGQSTATVVLLLRAEFAANQ